MSINSDMSDTERLSSERLSSDLSSDRLSSDRYSLVDERLLAAAYGEIDDYLEERPSRCTMFMTGGLGLALILIILGVLMSVLFGVFGWTRDGDNSKHLSFYTSDLGIASGIFIVALSFLYLFFNFLDKWIRISIMLSCSFTVAAVSFCVVDILSFRSANPIQSVPPSWWVCLSVGVVSLGFLLIFAGTIVLIQIGTR